MDSATEQDGGAGARGAAAEEGGQRVLLPHQLVHVLGPDLLLALVAGDQDVGPAGIAAVMQHDAEALGGELFRQRYELVVAAPPAGRKHDPRAAIADHAPMDVHPTDVAHRHRDPPRILLPDKAKRTAAPLMALKPIGGYMGKPVKPETRRTSVTLPSDWRSLIVHLQDA